MAAAAYAQEYPTKPIRIVTSEAGGGNDLQARLVSRGISGPLGQQVIVENRPSGVIPGDIVAKAQPNGYTLLLYNNTLWTGPLIQLAPYDPVRDFSPIALVARGPNVLVVNSTVPARSVAELIGLAKARPGELNYASSGTGATNHLAAELFKVMAGVDIVRIGYKGAGQALNDLIAGQVQVMFPTAGAAAPHVKAGRVRALAVTSAEPSTLAPGVPTVAASGLPGYESIAIYGLFAPARTPGLIIGRLNAEVARVLGTADVREKLAAVGMEAGGGNPGLLAATVKSEMARMARVIKAAGIRVD
ncbi:MAG TPA: tripartite tricarboxylate transporter substrate binding protein [Burkholderiales bacterium]|nr:tripartite tricarboxylate transporter substrate binding protein [Burkholderiales bacterium]